MQLFVCSVQTAPNSLASFLNRRLQLCQRRIVQSEPATRLLQHSIQRRREPRIIVDFNFSMRLTTPHERPPRERLPLHGNRDNNTAHQCTCARPVATGKSSSTCRTCTSLPSSRTDCTVSGRSFASPANSGTSATFGNYRLMRQTGQDASHAVTTTNNFPLRPRRAFLDTRKLACYVELWPPF